MDASTLMQRLMEAAEDPDAFELCVLPTIEELRQSPPDLELVDVILGFMETHSDVDFGYPGRLAHYMEQHRRHGYEERLLLSLRRQPTPHTVLLLGRVINGAKDARQRSLLMAAMERAGRHDAADDDTREMVADCLRDRRRWEL